MDFAEQGIQSTQPLNPNQKYPLDGQVFKNLIEASLTWLRTNMQAAWDEIATSAEHNIGRLTRMVAHGALMGARGNSGVILSQLWRGFARALHGKDIIDAPTLAAAFAEARDTAYK